MDILSDISPLFNGGCSLASAYMLFRIISIEKELERERKFFIEFRKNEAQTNQDLDRRLRNLELECHKRWSTWHP